MLQLAAAAIAAIALYYAFGPGASGSSVKYIKLVTPSSGPKLQYLDRDNPDPAVKEAIERLVSAEGLYILSDEKTTTTKQGATYYSLTGTTGAAPSASSPKLLSRLQALTAGTLSYTLMNIPAADAILAGSPPSTIEYRVIIDPALDDRSLVAEGSPWFVYQMTSKS